MIDALSADFGFVMERGMYTSEAYERFRVLNDRYGVYAPGATTYKSLPQPCQSPTEWDEDHSVCAVCGRLIELHAKEPLRTSFKPYEEALLTWLVRHGGVDNFYGAYEDTPTVLVRAHVLDSCGVDVTRTRVPQLQPFDEFNGTFAEDSAHHNWLATKITCKCDKVHELEWVLKKDISLGEIIFQVVKEGETSGDI